jgi:hypothetical protein
LRVGIVPHAGLEPAGRLRPLGELVDGTPRATASSSPRYGVIHAEAARLIGNRLAALRPVCRVITEVGSSQGAR